MRGKRESTSYCFADPYQKRRGKTRLRRQTIPIVRKVPTGNRLVQVIIIVKLITTAPAQI